jgi:hypothetical protein
MVIGFAAINVFFNSCKKDITNNPTDQENSQLNKEVITKVNAWLDSQKPANKPNKKATIELLKNNLDFSKLRVEEFKGNEQFLVIPVNEDFKTKKNVNKGTIPVLLLVVDKSGNINKGNLVLYIPQSGTTMSSLPNNTFYKMYYSKELDCSGMFRFLDITGGLLYQVEYENGKFHSIGQLQKKPSTNSQNTGARAECQLIDWYIVTTYSENGIVIWQSEEYIGTTCVELGDGCDDPNLASICGAPTGGTTFNADECISAGVDEFTQEANGTYITSVKLWSEITDVDPFTKNKNPVWECLTGLGGWSLNSHEKGKIKLIDVANNTWAWKSLEHDQITFLGSPLPITHITYTNGVGTPSFTPEAAEASNIFYAGMSLDFTVTYTFVCNCPNIPVVGWVPPITNDYTSTALWDARPL